MKTWRVEAENHTFLTLVLEREEIPASYFGPYLPPPYRKRVNEIH